MFCKNCGKELSDNAFVCPHCGALVAEDDRNGEKRPKNKTAFGLCIAGFVLSILSLVWLGAYFCITPIASIVLSAVGVHLAKKNGDAHGLGTAGFVIGIVATAIWGLIWIAAAAWLGALIAIV
ncbi:MAG: zinc-ribbon domain-containing protein [Candidatus Gallimonas sp.]